MKRKKGGEKIIYLKLNKKELDFLNKLCRKKAGNVSRSMILNHFFSLCKSLPLDVNGIKNKTTLKKEILNTFKKY
jgi:hypothetical protein